MTIFNHKSMARTPSQRAGASRLSAPGYRLGVLVLLLIVLGNPISAVAQCPGTMENVSSSPPTFLIAVRSATTMWPASISSCFNSPTMTTQIMGMGFGATLPAGCTASINPAGMSAFFQAYWFTAPVAGGNGCTFNCPNTAAGNCQVLPDGLPVELMEFSVEDDGASSD